VSPLIFEPLHTKKKKTKTKPSSLLCLYFDWFCFLFDFIKYKIFEISKTFYFSCWFVLANIINDDNIVEFIYNFDFPDLANYANSSMFALTLIHVLLIYTLILM